MPVDVQFLCSVEPSRNYYEKSP